MNWLKPKLRTLSSKHKWRNGFLLPLLSRLSWNNSRMKFKNPDKSDPQS